MNTYQTSSGERFTQSQIDYKIRIAKLEKLKQLEDELGYVVCQRCHRNDCTPIDVSHNISVKEAKESGQTELCWALSNLEVLGRECHKIKDGLNLQFRKIEI